MKESIFIPIKEEDLKPEHRKQECSVCKGIIKPFNEILIFDRTTKRYCHINCFELVTGRKWRNLYKNDKK